MKVLVVCAAGYVSGKEIMSLHLMKGLKERGHKCHCIMSDWTNGDFEVRLRRTDIPHVKLRIGFISKVLSWSAIIMTLEQLIYLPWVLLKYRRILKGINPDVIVHTNFHHLFLLFPVIGSSKNIYWSHEIIRCTSFYTRLFQFFAKRIKIFIGVSSAVSMSLERLVPKSYVRTVKNGIPHPEVALQLYKGGKEYNIAIIGQVTKHKGHELLFNAIATCSKIDSFKVHVVGTGNYQFIIDLKKLAEHLKITDKILWRGFIENVDEIYRDIDVVIVPTLTPDPYPTTVMEACFRAIPIIVSDTGGLPEMVENGGNGFIFRTGQSASLAAAIDRMFTMSDFDLMKKQSLDFANKHFKISKFIDEFENLINEVYSGKFER